MTSGSRKDAIVTFGAASVSTYLLNWLKKKASTLTKISNLSNKYIFFDSCDGANAEVPSIPTDMKPKTEMAPGGVTQFESFNPAGIVGNFIEKALKENIWVRCSFLTNFEQITENFKEDENTYHPRTKITILLTVRGSSKTYDTEMESAMAIGMCRKTSATECSEYDTLKDMMAYVEIAIANWRKKENEMEPSEVGIPDEIRIRTGAQRDKDNNIRVTGKSTPPTVDDLQKPTEKDEMRIMVYSKSEDVESKPIYFCHNAAGHCISAMMGSGSSSESEVFIHDLDGDLPRSLDQPTKKAVK